MKIETNTQSKRCDFGACGCSAKFSIVFDNCAGDANIDICEGCLKKLRNISKRLINDKQEK